MGRGRIIGIDDWTEEAFSGRDRAQAAADELAAAGQTGEQLAAELGVSAATLYNWLRAYGGVDIEAAQELKELRDQNALTPGSRGCWPRRGWKRTPCGRWRREILSPAAKRRAIDMLIKVTGMSQRAASKAVELARSVH